jgi:hypothetical protein
MWHILVRCRDGRASRRSEWRREPARREVAMPGGVAAHKGSSGERCGMRESPVADRRLDPAALHPDGHLDRLDTAGPTQDGVVGGLADGQDQVVDNLARDGGRQLLQAGSHGARPSPARQVGDAARRFPSYRPLPALRPSWPGGGSCRPG